MDNNDCRWPVVMGTTESGEGRVFDYSKASNILVAGGPKQGKSTAIRIIVDALKSCPEASGMQFRVIDIDINPPAPGRIPAEASEAAIAANKLRLARQGSR